MSGISHLIGSDLSFSQSGDLAVASQDEMTIQRVLRRLLTNPGEYIWNLGYGAGLPAMVGDVADAGAIAAVIRYQMMLEATVAKDPEPSVEVSATTTGIVSATVQYVDAPTGQLRSFVVPIT